MQTLEMRKNQMNGDSGALQRVEKQHTFKENLLSGKSIHNCWYAPGTALSEIGNC